MIIAPFICNITNTLMQDYIPPATLASGIKTHCGSSLQLVRDTVKNQTSIKTLSIFESHPMVLGLFVGYQSDFLLAVTQTANALELSLNSYITSNTQFTKDDVTRSIDMINDFMIFEASERKHQEICYKIIHFIVVDVITHIFSYYNLQEGLLARRVDAFEASKA